MSKRFAWVVVLALKLALPAHAAIQSANLPDPERGLRVFFPEMKTFSAKDYTKARQGTPGLNERLSRITLSPADPEFEGPQVPYTFYAAESDAGVLGYVVGINQRGDGGPIQLFVALTPEGQLKDVHVEQLTTADVRLFRSPEYRVQVRQFSLQNLPEEALFAPPSPNPETPPTADVIRAHHWVMRGLRMALGLYAEFKLRPVKNVNRQ